MNDLLHICQVIGLDLSQEGISGGLNDSSSILFSLDKLQRLSLAYNKFNFKPIPSRLEVLDLSSRFSNRHSPLQLEKPNLAMLVHNLHHLTDLYLDGVNMSAIKSDWCQVLSSSLPNLKVLSLSSCYLSGPIDESLQGLHNLTTLDLSYNNLSIETSSGDFNMSPFPQISSLKLVSCNLQTFPNLKNQSSLSHLDLSDNNIGGEIPSWIWGSYNGGLLYMNISHNQVVGLQTPYVFPKHLSIIDLHSNWLGGVIPRPPPFVTYIDYSENLFSSSIPTNIGHNLTLAIFFSVSRNSLTGRIPQTICNASYLKVLDLSHNGFRGRIPECVFKFGGDLGVLKLGNNNLDGLIEGTFTSNCSLSVLDLHWNSLEGKIPRSLVNCKSLEVLNLGNNRTTDTYPCFLRNNSKLRVLILRSNRLYGGLHCNPAQSTTWEKLQILDIAFNEFTGVVSADWFRNWHAMLQDPQSPEYDEKHLSFMVFQLDQFYYQQTVTVTTKGRELELVRILTIFTSMDISNNHFEGEIPSTVGHLKMLYLLDMSNNEFIGSIPPSIGDLYHIESLDLSANKLGGEIPSVLTRLSFLSDFDVSYNQLEGRIPVGSQFQTFTNNSFKGNPRLCGPPLAKSCEVSGPATTPPASTKSHGNAVRSEVLISVGLGFVVGVGILVLPLIFYGRWNRWYFQHVDHIFFTKLHRYFETRKRMRRAYRNPIQRLYCSVVHKDYTAESTGRKHRN
ncbi:hypothetical protein L6452_02338 [Arctium lappa]|uniref:Uncharacterized protein n=1 Tax=Arctium lappa TaxID=4217 RepID=A0ACB9FIT8_ARCLA|nr:hypothetical protein L6452_02338 [Arctium lappa]